MRARNNPTVQASRNRGLLLTALLALSMGGAACTGGNAGTSTGNPTDGSKDGMNPDLPGFPGGGSLTENDPTTPGHNPIPTNGEDSALGGTGYFCEADDEVLDGLDADTGLGFTAQDILDFAAGSHEEAIRWHDTELASFGPEKGEHRVTIEVSYDDGEVRLMTPKAPAGGGEEPAIDIGFIGPGCSPWLEIEVEMTIRSDEDALNETGTVVLRTRNRLQASMHASPDPDELEGELEVLEVSLEGFELTQLDLNAVFTPFGVNGNLYGTFTNAPSSGGNATDGVAAAGGGPIADFGRKGCVYEGFAVGLDSDIDGASAQDALDLLERAQDVQIAWNDGTTTTGTLGFTPEGDTACVSLDQQAVGDVSIYVPGTIELATEDGVVEGGWIGELRATVDAEGAITQVMVQLDQSGKMPPVDIADFADTYGFAGLETGDYDQLMLQFMTAVAANGDGTSVMGQLKVNGLKFAPCAGGDSPEEEQGGGSDPSDPPPDQPADMAVPPTDPGASMGGSSGSSGMGTPGCKGADFFDVLTGTVTSP